jgi:hypothetical protein
VSAVLQLAGADEARRGVRWQGGGKHPDDTRPGDSLVTVSRAEYIDRAVAPATNAERLESYRERLAANIKTSPLFDVQRFAAHWNASRDYVPAS